MTPMELVHTFGPGTRLVARPRGVIHVSRGPLTPSGRFLAAAGRAECRARTRRLHVLNPVLVGAQDDTARRVCARCTAKASRRTPGPATVLPSAAVLTREQVLKSYAGTTSFDLAMDAFMAESEAEVERVEWLALVLVGYPACAKAPVVSPDGKVTAPLDTHLARARRRLGCTKVPMEAALREFEVLAKHIKKKDRHEAWRERENRIARLGYVLAMDGPPRKASA